MKLAFFAFTLLAASMVACKKDPMSSDPGTTPLPKMKLLLNDYVSNDTIDSDFIKSNLNGTSDRLQLIPDNYDVAARIAVLLPGIGKMTIADIFQK